MITKEDIVFINKELEKIQNLFANGNFDKVIKKTKILLKKDPTQPVFYNMIGLSYRQLNNFELAEKTSSGVNSLGTFFKESTSYNKFPSSS